MNNSLKTITLFLLTVTAVTAFAEQQAGGNTNPTVPNHGVTTIDALDIDVDIKVDGAIFLQRGATGNIATITLDTLDASAVQLTKKVLIEGDTNLGELASISEANIHLTGDMARVSIDSNYQRKGKLSLANCASLNVGNIVVRNQPWSDDGNRPCCDGSAPAL